MRANSSIRGFKDDTVILISVIVPAYNASSSVVRCLTSIDNQTYWNFELIVVDDGSTDGTGRICDSLATEDRRVRVIHQKNAGVAAARNAGLAAAKGEWILFIDSDDYVEPDYLETLLGACLEGGADLSFCKTMDEDPSGHLVAGGYSPFGANRELQLVRTVLSLRRLGRPVPARDDRGTRLRREVQGRRGHRLLRTGRVEGEKSLFRRKAPVPLRPAGVLCRPWQVRHGEGHGARRMEEGVRDLPDCRRPGRLRGSLHGGMRQVVARRPLRGRPSRPGAAGVSRELPSLSRRAYQGRQAKGSCRGHPLQASPVCLREAQASRGLRTAGARNMSE